MAELFQNARIIRNRLKLAPSVNNAKLFLEVQKELGTLDKYIWSFVDYKPIKNHVETLVEMPDRTELSDKISSDMKKRGFKFVGSAIFIL